MLLSTSDQYGIQKLLTDTIKLLCKNSVLYNSELNVEGLLGITVDKKEVYLINIKETFGSDKGGNNDKNVSETVPGKHNYCDANSSSSKRKRVSANSHKLRKQARRMARRNSLNNTEDSSVNNMCKLSDVVVSAKEQHNHVEIDVCPEEHIKTEPIDTIIDLDDGVEDEALGLDSSMAPMDIKTVDIFEQALQEAADNGHTGAIEALPEDHPVYSHFPPDLPVDQSTSLPLLPSGCTNYLDSSVGDDYESVQMEQSRLVVKLKKRFNNKVIEEIPPFDGHSFQDSYVGDSNSDEINRASQNTDTFQNRPIQWHSMDEMPAMKDNLVTAPTHHPHTKGSKNFSINKSTGLTTLCRVCGKMVATRQFVRHYRLHTEMYKCEFCHRGFNRKDNLRRHYTLRHNVHLDKSDQS